MGTLTNSAQRATKLADQIIADVLTFYVSSGGQRKELSQQIQAPARAVAMQLVARQIRARIKADTLAAFSAMIAAVLLYGECSCVRLP